MRGRQRPQPEAGQDVGPGEPVGGGRGRVAVQRARPEQPAELRPGAGHRAVAGLERPSRPARSAPPAAPRSAAARAAQTGSPHRGARARAARRSAAAWQSASASGGAGVAAVRADDAGPAGSSTGVDGVAPALLREAARAARPARCGRARPPRSSAPASQPAAARQSPRARRRARRRRARSSTTSHQLSRRPSRSTRSAPSRTGPAGLGEQAPATGAELVPDLARLLLESPGRRAVALPRGERAQRRRGRPPGAAGRTCSEVIERVAAEQRVEAARVAGHLRRQRRVRPALLREQRRRARDGHRSRSTTTASHGPSASAPADRLAVARAVGRDRHPAGEPVDRRPARRRG